MRQRSYTNKNFNLFQVDDEVFLRIINLQMNIFSCEVVQNDFISHMLNFPITSVTVDLVMTCSSLIVTSILRMSSNEFTFLW